LKVLTGHGATIDTTRPEGRLIFAVFAGLAEFERELIRERTNGWDGGGKVPGPSCRQAAQADATPARPC